MALNYQPAPRPKAIPAIRRQRNVIICETVSRTFASSKITREPQERSEFFTELRRQWQNVETSMQSMHNFVECACPHSRLRTASRKCNQLAAAWAPRKLTSNARHSMHASMRERKQMSKRHPQPL